MNIHISYFILICHVYFIFFIYLITLKIGFFSFLFNLCIDHLSFFLITVLLKYSVQNLKLKYKIICESILDRSFRFREKQIENKKINTG